MDDRDGRSVAIKIARSPSQERAAGARLVREARAASAVSHPNVCAVSDVGTLPDRRTYLVMECLRGETLTAHLARNGCLDDEDAIEIALQLLAALDAAHAVGIVHRDVKPDNVFLVSTSGSAPVVKLLDFGLCRIHAPALADNAALTLTGHVVGTPEYMSPEQVYGDRAFHPRIDVYAVGVILYEMLSGRRAFAGKDVRAVVRSVLTRPPMPLSRHRPELPRVLERIVSRAMARDRHRRYATAAEFRSDLLEATIALGRRSSPALELDDPYEGAGAWDAPTFPRAPVSPRPSSR